MVARGYVVTTTTIIKLLENLDDVDDGGYHTQPPVVEIYGEGPHRLPLFSADKRKQ